MSNFITFIFNTLKTKINFRNNQDNVSTSIGVNVFMAYITGSHRFI